MTGLSRWAIVVLMAFRDLGAHRVKTLVVGTLLAFGTFLVVTGGALLQSVSGTMQKSITSSLAGHIQVYSDEAEDELALFGGGMDSHDIGEIDEFGPVRDALLQVDNVEAVVPMGLAIGQVFGRSELDLVLEELRAAVQAEDWQRVDTQAEHLRAIAASLEQDSQKLGDFVADQDQLAKDVEAVQRVQNDAFWQELRQDPAAALDYLDTRVASLSVEGGFYFMRCIGTDLTIFADSFDRFEIVRGQMVPDGRRGILLSRRYYDTNMKNAVARELDELLRAVQEEGQRIADDATLQNRVQANAEQYQRVLFQLTPEDGRALRSELADYLGTEGELDDLLQAFLAVDDRTLADRHAWFYDHIAPRIRLHEFDVGEVITLYGQTRTGYQRAVNVKLWGIYEFSGLERSDLAAAGQLIDMITFRALYGKMTASQKAELEDIRESVGIRELDRESAEDALFGGPPAQPEPVAQEAAQAPSAFAEFEEDGDVQLEATGGGLDERVYSRQEMADGLALNAAVILEDDGRQHQTMATIRQVSEDQDLGLRVVGWQQASGIVGQLIMVLQGIITVAILIVFVVTLVVINNTMVMTTMDRTAEIGTMRAIGAQRGFVVWLFLLESVVLGLLAGAAGAVLSLAFVGWLGQVGIPAVQDVLVITFAGPRLYPEVSVANVVVGIVSVMLIGGLSTLYPAILAARVRPVVAMQRRD